MLVLLSFQVLYYGSFYRPLMHSYRLGLLGYIKKGLTAQRGWSWGKIWNKI